MRTCTILLLALSLVGCHKAAVTVPVPGSINTVDAYAYRSVSDAQAALTSVKTWEQCSVMQFPPTVTVDGVVAVCDPAAGPFPAAYKGVLDDAINAYNVAQAAAKAYHAGAISDTTALTAAITQLTSSIAAMLTKVGGH